MQVEARLHIERVARECSIGMALELAAGKAIRNQIKLTEETAMAAIF